MRYKIIRGGYWKGNKFPLIDDLEPGGHEILGNFQNLSPICILMGLALAFSIKWHRILVSPPAMYGDFFLDSSWGWKHVDQISVFF